MAKDKNKMLPYAIVYKHGSRSMPLPLGPRQKSTWCELFEKHFQDIDLAATDPYTNPLSDERNLHLKYVAGLDKFVVEGFNWTAEYEVYVFSSCKEAFDKFYLLTYNQV
jgi:hypothetical protein